MECSVFLTCYPGYLLHLGKICIGGAMPMESNQTYDRKRYISRYCGGTTLRKGHMLHFFNTEESDSNQAQIFPGSSKLLSHRAK